MKNKKGLIFGTIGTLIGMGIAAWMDRKKTDPEETTENEEIIDVPAEEVEVETEEVTEG